SADRWTADGRRHIQRRLGADGVWAGDCRDARRGAEVRLGDRIEPRAGNLHRLESGAVVERPAQVDAVGPSLLRLARNDGINGLDWPRKNLGRAVEGLYKVEYDIGDGSGRSVLYAHGGTMLGGNTAFAHFGTYETVAGEIVARLRTKRHSRSPQRRSLT